MCILSSATVAVSAAPQGRFAPTPWFEQHPDWRSLDQRLDPQHRARHIRQALALLDLSALWHSYHGVGSAAFRPDLLLAVVLYELDQGRRSPAQWYRDAHQSEPVRWLLRGYQPSRSCWYAFRDRLAGKLDDWHRQLLHLAVQQELTPATRAAIDGTLVAANASRHRLLNQKQLTRRLLQLQEHLDADDSGDVLAQKRPYWMATTPRGRRRQQQRYRQAQQRLEQLQQRNRQKRACKRKPAEKIVVSPSDPEAALGLDKHKVYRPLYNVQVVDDLDSPLLLAYQVFAQPNDDGLLKPLLERQRDWVGQGLQLALVDSGYLSGPDVAEAEAAGVTLYGPWQSNDASGPRSPQQLPKEQFRWLADEQVYECPQGQRLELAGCKQQKSSGTRSQLLYQYRCPAAYCQGCPLREKCVPHSKGGRTISRSEHEESVERLRSRMATEAGQALYRLRRQTAELAYADLKEHRGLRRFSGRGLRRAETEAGLLVLIHNLLTIRSLLGERNLPPPSVTTINENAS
jgi:transposase